MDDANRKSRELRAEPLRILVVTRTFTEPGSERTWGGVQVYEHKLCEALAARGHRLILLANQKPPASYDSIPLQRAAVPIPTRFGRPQVRRACRGIVDLARREAIDIVYFSEVPRVFGPICQQVGAAGLPFVVAVHNHRANHVETRRGVAKRRARLGVGHAARIITPSHWMRDALRPVIGDAGTTIHPGVDPALEIVATPERVEEARRRLGLEGRRSVLFMGRFAARKRGDAVIRLMPRLARRFDDVVLLAVGDGPMRAEWLELAASLGVAERVRWVSHIASHEVGIYHKLADVLALVSYPKLPSDTEEAFALVKLEAGLCSTPVVAVQAGGIPEGIVDGATGLLVPPRDADALYGALERVLEDTPLRSELGQRARGHVREHYTWGRVARETEQVLRESLQR